jgi:bifunctional DNase/RNase
MEVEMKIRGLMMDPVTNMPIVILKDMSGNAVLPIWVGVYEANAIALEIEKVSTPRPMTHDLIKQLLLGLNTALRKVVVSELREDTFYAVIWLDREGDLISVDSRPSDALALALRLDCPIYVEESVLKSSKQASAVTEKVNNEELRRWLEGLNDEDLGRQRHPDGRTGQGLLHVCPRELRGVGAERGRSVHFHRQLRDDDGKRSGLPGVD